jgi:hypothetical protein
MAGERSVYTYIAPADKNGPGTQTTYTFSFDIMGPDKVSQMKTIHDELFALADSVTSTAQAVLKAPEPPPEPPQVMPA